MDAQKPMVVVGLGKTGLSCVHHLVAKNQPVWVTDDRQSPPGLAQLQQQFPQIPLALGAISTQMLAQASEIILSPGIDSDQPLFEQPRAQGIPIVGDIELFARQVQAPVVAITGSNGKTTVTTLLGQMIARAGYQAEVCGNIGEPVLTALQRPVPDFYVLELSSFQLETTYSLCPTVATIINMSPDHLDRHVSYAAYQKAKQRIYQHCQQAVVNADESDIWQSCHFSQPPIAFSLHANAEAAFYLRQDANQQDELMYGQQPLLKAAELSLSGRHHLQNALCGLAMGQVIGLPMQTMLAELREFSGLAHRCQLIASAHAAHWYNDSKGTNVGASEAAIQTLGARLTAGQKLILIAGGQGKQADFSTLQPVVAKFVDQLIVFGEDAPLLAAALEQHTHIRAVDSLDAAVCLAAKNTAAGDVVLFSPACASFDMFDNYQHRGETFINLVQQL